MSNSRYYLLQKALMLKLISKSWESNQTDEQEQGSSLWCNERGKRKGEK